MHSFLNFKQITQLIEELNPPLIEFLSPYQLVAAAKGGTAEGPCIELRIGRVFINDVTKIPVLGYDNFELKLPSNVVRFFPKQTLIHDYQIDGFGKEFELQLGSSIILETVEKINLPNRKDLSLLGILEPRFSLPRMGLLLLKSDADPGYCGKIIVRLTNIGPFPTIKLQLGTRFLKLRFISIPGENPTYSGKYGGKPGDIFEER